jgi:phage tail P2-like protein
MPKTTALLLPPNRSPLETALVQTLHTLEHPERTVAALYRPSAAGGIAAALLPWLAWGNDVLAWPRTADETQRRALTANSWHLHRQMGTLAGLRSMAGVFGATITAAVVPPAKTYAGASLTTAERNAFVARYPQLRIYPQRLSGQRIGAMLLGCFPGGAAYPVQTDAALRLAPQAFLYRDGAETPLQAIERETTSSERTAEVHTEVRRPGEAGMLGFCSRPVRWLARSDAHARIYRLALETPYQDGVETLRRVAVLPGLSPLTVRYDWIAGRGQASGIFAGQHVNGHLRRSTARERIYKRMWLFDPALDVGRRAAMSFCDASRLTMPAHHAQLSVAMPGRANPQAARQFVRGFLLTSDRSNYHATLSALRDVARASDRIAIDTAVTQPLAASETLRAGGATAGEWRA